MKLTYQAALLSALALGMSACSIDTPWGNDGEGGISLRLSASADVKDAIPVLRSDAPALEAPDVADFSVSLTNLSTSEVKTWPTLSDFQNQKSFGVGSYTLTAFYGNPEDEGFEKPYFSGSTEVQVLEARQSEATVVAQLANSMVSIDYTDAFRNYFSDYAVTVHSEGHSYIEFAKDETRPAFLTPGEVAISVRLKNPSGKEVTLQPAEFPAAARYHYHVTFDVNAPSTGDAQLQIVFDDSVVQDDVVIDLTEELFSSPAPKVTPSGFEDGQVLELLAGTSAPQPLKFDVVARGGISSALLTISGDGLNLPFGNEVELANASASLQEQLKSYGITTLGLFKNPSTLAYVDVSGLANHLPAGKYGVSLIIKDPYTRVSEPVTLNISTVPVQLSAEPGIAIFNSNQATVNVSYNGADPEKNISFKALANSGIYKDCEILSVTESTRTRSFEVKDYIFTISLPDTDRNLIPLKMYFGGEERKDLTVSVIIPEYDIEADAFTSYVKVKVNPKNASDMAAVVNCLHFFLNGSAVSESRITRNNESGMISIGGLDPATAYTLAYSLSGSGLADAEKLNFTSEKPISIDNGDFSQTSTTISRNMQVGGAYKCGAIEYTNWSQVKIDEPDGWASINAKTFYEGSTTINSWFTVASTYSKNEQVIVRSVGYDNNGKLPSVTGTFLSITHYNTSTPSISSKASGELFLGSYSFNGEENRVSGIPFTSRPSSLSFDCGYNPYGTDTGVALVEVLDASGSVIASGSRDITASQMHSETITLSGYPFGSKAASLRVQFKSSKGDFTLNIPNPSVDSWGGTLPIAPYHHNLGENNYHSYASGSELTLDNVKINF